jgi:hypothetical protein
MCRRSSNHPKLPSLSAVLVRETALLNLRCDCEVLQLTVNRFALRL